MEIRDSNLYKENYPTFESYCQQRWGIGIRQSQRLINASEVVQNLKADDQLVVLPSSEYQIRPLAALPPEVQRQVWKEVTNQERVTGKAVIEAVQQYNQKSNKQEIHFSSQSEEWYTPEEIIKLTIEVMGGIALDPCSNSVGQPNVPANKHFTAKDDGLSQKWEGSVYLNPPYGSGIGEWIKKLIHHYESAEVKEAIALLPSRTDTRWFSLLRIYPKCFIKGRLKFIGAEHAAPFPSVVVYLGESQSKFIRIFQKIGDVYQIAH